MLDGNLWTPVVRAQYFLEHEMQEHATNPQLSVRHIILLESDAVYWDRECSSQLTLTIYAEYLNGIS